MNSIELTAYMSRNIEALVKDLLRGAFRNPRQAAYLMRLSKYAHENERKRLAHERAGRHIPAFLISSLTSACNLTCKGCYARANGTCCDAPQKPLLTAAEWGGLFRQAAELGVSFNLLAGGEPMLRRDVLEEAARVESITFPVFTNGTLIDDEYLAFLDTHRNLVPILSMEGGEARTDARRGGGMHQKLLAVMDRLNARGILYGVSLTVTRENLAELVSGEFLSMLEARGCRLAFYIEYVPIDQSTRALALTGDETALLARTLDALRLSRPGMAYLSFPGDEQFLGGCLAAGRGFFHINPYGAAEPCPFSPYSDRSLRDVTLLEALSSPFFRRLQEDRLVGGEHDGGCALFAHEAEVLSILAQGAGCGREESAEILI